MQLQSVVPVLRIFSVEKAREFYVDFLGFAWDWEHRFDDNAPVYAQVSRTGLVLHLSEHHGGGAPGALININMSGIEELHRAVRRHVLEEIGVVDDGHDAPCGARPRQ